MKKLISIPIWVSTVIFLNIGCGETKKEIALKGGSLENTSWVLVKFPAHELQDLKLSLNFEKEKLHGNAVCNAYFSSYTTSGSTINLQPVGATRKMCASGSKLEMAYFDQLSKAHRYGIVGDTLRLKTPSGHLKFAKMAKVNKSLILKEDILGDLPLKSSIDTLEKGLKKLFPNENLLRKSEQLEDGTQEVLLVGTEEQLLKGMLTDNREQLKSLEISSGEIQDQYEVQLGMPFHEAKSLRPNIEIATDQHFHTYAAVLDSNIKYEICCNTDGPDKNDWSIEEVNDWKIQSIIWQNK
ncbi:MAG: META domain-containing protein [Aurantibacter sp.]